MTSSSIEAQSPTPSTKSKLSMMLNRTPVLKGADKQAKRKEIATYFTNTFDTYTSLFDCIAGDEGFYKQAIPLRHPLIFYLGHTATFFINKLMLAKLISKRVNPQLESTFAVGVDEMSWDTINTEDFEWPSIAEVYNYRRQVRALILELIETIELDLPINWESAWWPIVMGIEHERIHLETSSVLIRQLDIQKVQVSPQWQACGQSQSAPQNALITVGAGKVSLGKAFNDDVYGWDNEYGAHQADVAEFQASKYLVSNQEFLAFVEAGAYEQSKYWSDEGYAWREYSQATHPTFWRRHENTWQLRLMTQEVAMPWDWPVEVNFHEAKAFCEFTSEQSTKNIRLPTEDEWHRLCEASGVKEVTDYPSNANLHMDHYASPCSVAQFQHGQWFDVVGNVWQWTETPIYPFDEFKVHPLYDDFTTPTYDGQHKLIKGGSWISSGNETRLSARYAFRPHFFQHAGFRYISAEHKATQNMAYYESDQLLAQYAEFHFGEVWYNVKNFPKALVELALAAKPSIKTNKALDLGCACGRASFELAKTFSAVDGVDFSSNFIRLGVEMAEQGFVRYARPEEGELVSYHTRSLAELELDKWSDRVSFQQGDACNLKPELTGYDLVLAANLIDRLYQPKKLLENIGARINEGGLLIIASPYTWLEEHTPKEEWIGGYKKDGENYTTLDGLKAILSKDFKLITEPQKVPFVIRETQHKFQHTLSEVTVWERLADS